MTESISELIGYTAKELINDSDVWFNLIHVADLHSLLDAIEVSRTNLSIFRWEGRVKAANGTLKWVQCSSSPVNKRDGSIIWRGVLIDITGQRENETRLKEQQSLLIVSEKYVAIGEMAGALAHEINTPLAAIQLSIDMLESFYGDGQTSENEIKRIFLRLRNVMGNINSIISNVKAVGTKGTSSKRVEVSALQIVKDVLELFTERFERENILFHLETESFNDLVSVHPTQVMQILMNLIGNSIDALELKEQTSRRINIQIKNQNNSVYIDVSDNGPGISEDLLEQVNKPFFTTKPEGKGTGLGLPLCFKYAKANGGRLHILPSKMGASFRLELPKCKISLLNPEKNRKAA